MGVCVAMKADLEIAMICLVAKWREEAKMREEAERRAHVNKVLESAVQNGRKRASGGW